MRHRSMILAVSVSVLFVSAILQLMSQSAAAPALAEPSHGDSMVPSSAQDFILPGTQPNTLIHSLSDPSPCASCHANYSLQSGQPVETEIWRAWSGSMMAQSGRDPLFYAALDIANAGAVNSGEFCLRCHVPRGWLEGRSSTPDGSAMNSSDLEGVQCSFCHRMVDHEGNNENPARDEQILADLDLPVSTLGSGQFVMDPEDYRRGPFDITADLGLDPHEIIGAQGTLKSPFHQESEFCGTCHDISNPVFTWNEQTQTYEPNPLGEPGDIAKGFPLERTYSEWALSAFNSPQGIYVPQFGGNKTSVSTCQDCHMRDITGAGGAFFGGDPYIRQDMPLHDLTGGNTWVPQIIPMHPVFSDTFPAGSPRTKGLEDGIERAREMLRKAARLDVYKTANELVVIVYNESGHKLPTGYPEGRRMWLQVKGYGDQGQLIYSSGAYDNATGVLEGYQSDPTLKVYESKQGLTSDWAAQLGLPAGASFHFALNNQIVSDNRIPPRGYSFSKYNERQVAPYTNGAPDSGLYADGQYWDITTYTLPDGVVQGKVALLYQTASKEYIEFLRDNNPNASPNNGDILYDLWIKSNRSQPEVMAEARFSSQFGRFYFPLVPLP